MENIELNYERHGYLCIGDIKYGTVVTEIPGHTRSIYMKVNKNECGQGLRLGWIKGNSVLINLLSGSLRQISGSTKVLVLEEKLSLTPKMDTSEYRKEY